MKRGKVVGSFILLSFIISIGLASGECLLSSSSWNQESIPTQQGQVRFSFYATPSVNNINAIIGLSKGMGTTIDRYSINVRFSSSGIIDVGDGGWGGGDYGYLVPINYVPEKKYYIRMDVNISSRNYDVYVTPEGGSEIMIADNFNFRLIQPIVDSLDNFGIWSETSGTLNVCDFNYVDGGRCGQDSECNDNLYCDGIETCDIQTGECMPGNNPCGSLTCDEGRDICQFLGCDGGADNLPYGNCNRCTEENEIVNYAEAYYSGISNIYSLSQSIKAFVDSSGGGCLCGDGVLDSGEQCDDGNLAEGDGCGRTCLREECGNGYIDEVNGETCDDGNSVSGDGCNSICRVEFPNVITFNKTYGSNSVLGPGRYEKAKSAIQLADGSYVFAGESTSWNYPKTCIWLVKTSPLGSVCDYSSDGTCSNQYSFAKKFCSGSMENGKILRTSWDGGYLIAGETLKLDGKKDILLIKTDIFGNELWNKTFGWQGSNEDAVDLAPIGNIGAENGYLILGRTANGLFTSQPPTSWLIKINLMGDTCDYTNGNCDGPNAFVRIIGNKMTLMNQVIYQSDGFVLAGNTNSIGSVGMGGWLLKLNIPGNSCDYYSNANCTGLNQFSRFYKFSGEFNSVSRVLSPAGYIIGGMFYSPSNGNYQFLLAKTNSTGDTCNFMTWGYCNDNDKFATSNYPQNIYTSADKVIKESFNGDYVFIGGSENSTSGEKKAFLAKARNDGYICTGLTPEGECAYLGSFVKILGRSGENKFRSLKETSDQGYLLAGWTNSSNAGGKTQAWLIKTDINGEVN